MTNKSRAPASLAPAITNSASTGDSANRLDLSLDAATKRRIQQGKEFWRNNPAKDVFIELAGAFKKYHKSTQT